MSPGCGWGWSSAQRMAQESPSAGHSLLSVDPPPAVEKVQSSGRSETSMDSSSLKKRSMQAFGTATKTKERFSFLRMGHQIKSSTIHPNPRLPFLQ